MKFENEITVEVDTDVNSLINLIEGQGFKLKETYDLKDVYLINKNDKEDDYLAMLNNCILIRDIIEENKETKMVTYKYKEYNDKKEITKQGKIKVKIDNDENMIDILERVGFEELIKINDHLMVYSTDKDELIIQCVNDKHIYIEIESECDYADRIYSSIDEMKEVISKYNIPIKGNDYFVKKAEIELHEKYDKSKKLIK
jgi:predicted adenylyl cyclase CyaB